MAKFFILAIMVLTTNAFGQTTPSHERSPKLSGVPITKNTTDTTLKVIYENKKSSRNLPAYLLNGKLVNEAFILNLNPRVIESIDIVKENVQVGGFEYHGQILIKTKSTYNPKLISLTELKAKHTNLKNESAIFTLDHDLITADYDQYLVDENNLFRIIIEKVDKPKENVNLNIIKLLTKSEENIKKSQEIRIRGTEVTLAH